MSHTDAGLATAVCLNVRRHFGDSFIMYLTMNKLPLLCGLLLVVSVTCQRKPDTTARPVPSDPWITFSDPSHQIQFQYPARYRVRVERDSDPLACDSAIMIGYLQKIPADSANPVQFIDAVRIYQTKGSFFDIADKEGFENGFVASDSSRDSVGSFRIPSPLDWIIKSSGDQQRAEDLEWQQWAGLKGNGTVMYFRREGGSAGVGEFTRYFLLRTRSDGCNVVVSFFDGLLVPHADDPQDPDLIPTEAEFKKVVLSINLQAARWR